MSHLMFIGAGDLGVRTADMLIRRDQVSELTLVDLPNGGGSDCILNKSGCICLVHRSECVATRA